MDTDNQAEKEALKDVSRLCQWLKENINSNKEYIRASFPKERSQSYLLNIFKDKSLFTNSITDEYDQCNFYVYLEDNKLLKCSYTDAECIFELFTNADKFIINSKIIMYNIPNIFGYDAYDKRVMVNIQKDFGKKVSDSHEYIYDSFAYNQLGINYGIHLVDILKPITVLEIYQEYDRVKEESDKKVEVNKRYAKSLF